MQSLKYTLIADGSSDKVLMQIIKWSLDDLFPNLLQQGSFADFRHLTDIPRTLAERIALANHIFPADILIVHRDAESVSLTAITERTTEIFSSLDSKECDRVICIIPVKMTEAWLLFDEEAIKKAAGNRHYKDKIDLPSFRNLEKERQPKVLLHRLLREASGLKGRQLKKFNVDKAVHLVAENIEDFKPLRHLAAFNAFEKELKKVVDQFLKASNQQ